MRAIFEALRDTDSGWYCIRADESDGIRFGVATAKNVPEIMQRIRKWIEEGTK